MVSDEFVVPRFLQTPSPEERARKPREAGLFADDDDTGLGLILEEDEPELPSLFVGRTEPVFDHPSRAASIEPTIEDPAPAEPIVFEQSEVLSVTAPPAAPIAAPAQTSTPAPAPTAAPVPGPGHDVAHRYTPAAPVPSVPLSSAPLVAPSLGRVLPVGVPDGFSYVDIDAPAATALVERFRIVQVHDPLDVLIAERVESKVFGGPGIAITASISPPAASIPEYGQNPTDVHLDWSLLQPLVAQVWNELTVHEYFHESRFEGWLDFDGHSLLVTLTIDDYTTLWKFTDAFRAAVEAAAQP